LCDQTFQKLKKNKRKKIMRKVTDDSLNRKKRSSLEYLTTLVNDF